MRPGTARLDRELSAHARQLGFVSSNCDGCGASGRRGPRVDPDEPRGSASDMACGDCAGSGRWWYPATRPLGTFTAHLTDRELRARTSAGTATGATHGY